MSTTGRGDGGSSTTEEVSLSRLCIHDLPPRVHQSRNARTSGPSSTAIVPSALRKTGEERSSCTCLRAVSASPSAPVIELEISSSRFEARAMSFGFALHASPIDSDVGSVGVRAPGGQQELSPREKSTAIVRIFAPDLHSELQRLLGKRGLPTEGESRLGALISGLKGDSRPTASGVSHACVLPLPLHQYYQFRRARG